VETSASRVQHPLPAALASSGWGLAVSRVAPAPGHTNQTWFLDDRLVLRRSWPGKPLARIEREEHALRWLAGAGLPVPRLIPTPGGQDRAWDGSRALHLFERRPGSTVDWRVPLTPDRALAAIGCLDRVHSALASFPEPLLDDDPLGPLARRLNALAAAPPLTPLCELAESWERFEVRARALLEDARSLPWRPAGWLHGDFHPGNLLFEGDEVSAVLDLDDLCSGSPDLELALGCLLVARRDDEQAGFSCVTAVWARAMEACPQDFLGGALDREVLAGLRPLAALHLALVHLQAAARGLWRLEPGVGFLPCWRTVLA
jgi:aminoglycoside phosphotransferase (APT) family kinase protein